MAQNWFEHAFRRGGWRPERQVVALATLGAVIALLLGALYLFQVANEASVHGELRDLQTERDELERLNQELRSEIAGLTSVPNLQVRAREMGFHIATAGELEYLLVEGYNPLEVDTVAPVDVENIDDEGDTNDDYDATFLGWLGQQWDRVTDIFE